MCNARLAAAFLTLVPLAGLAGCGGHGEGYRVPVNPIVITTTALPAINSGEVLNFTFDFTGGGGGPYLLEVIEGSLPAGVGLDNGTVGLTGRPLENGTFEFTIKLTDTGTQPFSTTTQHFVWNVGIGSLVFVTDANLPPWIFNGFGVANLVLAGGTPPYTCEVVDDPLNLNDEALPPGLSIPTDSCTILGAPTGTKPADPFVYKISVRATDANGQTALKEYTVTVLVPPVVIVTTTLLNGICGVAYADGITISSGIPPFNHTLVTAVNSTTKLVGEPGSVGGVAKGAAPSAYALDSALSPYSGKFPEGLTLRETDAAIIGSPRRAGTFANFVYRVNSQILPAVASQNAWKAYTFAMADSTPPVVALDATGVLAAGSTFSPTLAAATLPTASNFMIRSPEFGVSFNPITFKATGGVKQDGKYDAPHTSQVANNPGETVGGYDWSGSSFPAGIPAGMAFSSTGVFSGTPAARSGFQVFNAVVRDVQLPTPGSAAHTASGFCRFDIGPDWVVITETSDSSSAPTFDTSMEFPSQRVEILEPKTGSAVVRALSNALDMATTHTHPLGGTLDGSLTNIDFLRVSVNPTWWAYDAYNANAQGARTMQHADPERFINSQAFGGDSQRSYSYPNDAASFPEGFEHASNPAIEIPEARGASPFAVTHNPAAGVYANGGLLYAYDQGSEFGFFIVRKDSKIQIPVAFDKSTFAGFGDAWITSSSSYSGLLRIPQITVSPDGRLAACKLKISVDNFAETVDAGQRVVVFCLTGEKPFGGATFKVLQPGGSGDSTDGMYLYADSLALTNHALYALRGNNRGDLGGRVIYGDHWVYRAALFNPTTGADLGATTMSLLGSGTGGVGGWSNSTNNPISVTYCKWATPGTNSLPSGFTGGPWNHTTAPAENNYPSQVTPAVFGDNWANFGDSSGAPAPFRVSANGKACAVIAGSNGSAASPYTTNFLRRSIYVDFNQTFREAATTTRRYQPAARLVGVRVGEQENYLYGLYDGPATQFEISDSGARIGVVYNASTQSWSDYGSSNAGFTDAYEAVCALDGTGASTDPWASKTERLVTHPTGTPIFVNTVQWRMGSLAFTRDNAAFVFWAGYGMENPTSFSSTYCEAGQLSGSLYAFTFGTTSVDGILPTSQGGHVDITGTFKNYTTSTQVLHLTSGYSYTSGNYNGAQGSVLPIGCFYSNDGNFFYVNSLGAITTSDAAGSRLIGVNVKDTSSTTNGRVALRAFAPTWVTQRGFTNGTYAYPGMTVRGMGGPTGSIGDKITAAGHPGLLFFAANYQPNSGTQDYTSWSGGGPRNNTYWGDYGAYSGELYGIDASVGGNLFTLSNISGASTSTGRTVNYIQPNRNATRVAYVSRAASAGYYSSGGFSTYGQAYPGQEQLRIISNLAVTASGSLSGTQATAVLEGAASGRVSSSVALDFSDRRIYYGYSTSGSESGMKLWEKTIDGTGAVIAASTRSFNGIGGTTNRFAVLWSGR